MSQTENRKVLFGGLSAGQYTKDVAIPSGGGNVTTIVTAANLGLSSLSNLLNVQVNTLYLSTGSVNEVYAPSAGINATSDAVGITLAAGVGASLSVTVTAFGT